MNIWSKASFVLIANVNKQLKNSLAKKKHYKKKLSIRKQLAKPVYDSSTDANLGKFLWILALPIVSCALHFLKVGNGCIYIYICFVEVVPRSTGDQIKTSKPCKSAIYVRHISKEKKKDAAKIKHTCKQVVFLLQVMIWSQFVHSVLKNFRLLIVGCGVNSQPHVRIDLTDSFHYL